MSTQLKLSDLIQALTVQLDKHGDVPLILHDGENTPVRGVLVQPCKIKKVKKKGKTTVIPILDPNKDFNPTERSCVYRVSLWGYR